MLRQTLIGLGVLIALLQFPGFPYDVARWLSMLSGLAIVFLLTVAKKEKGGHTTGGTDDEARTLNVERRKAEERPLVRQEEESSLDDATDSSLSDITVERKVTIVRTRRQKQGSGPSGAGGA